MTRLLSAKSLLVAAAALGVVGVASAHTDVQFSVGIPVQAYVAPAPVYVQPRPVYVEPQVSYYSGYYGRDDWRWRHHHRYVEARRYGPWGDADHDGVPNRYDRAPYNAYRY